MLSIIFTIKKTLNMKFVVYILLIVFSSTIFAATANEVVEDTILFSIGGEEVTLSEFKYVYEKSNLKKEEAYSKQSLEEYLALYINFKLKVLEAEAMQYDTIPSVITELEKYKNQLSKSYLNDKEITSQLVKEAYERLAYDINASHILIRCEENADPEDTITAFRKATKVYNRVTKKKEDFATVAVETSEDPSVNKNQGNLGYFTALQMVYPFENAAYNTESGKVAKIFRTKFGYHVMKINDKRETLGKIHVAHIFAKIPKGANNATKEAAKAKINGVYQKYTDGDSFESLAARFSDDKGSAQKGGAIRLFGAGEMVKEFEDAAFALKNNGDVSKPIISPYGYHIIKRLDHKGLNDFSVMEKELKKKIKRDSRSNVAHQILIDRIKKEYNYTVNEEVKETLFSLMDSSIFKSQWTPDSTADLNKTLFTLGDLTYTAEDLASFIIELKRVKRKISMRMLYLYYFNSFVDNECIKYEESKLEEKYPEFKALMQEYNDGILLFEITDDQVWNKAVEDTTGLELYYETVKHYYMWEQRMESSIYTCIDSLTSVQLLKYLSKKKVKSSEWLLKKFNPEGTEANLVIEKAKFEKGDNKFVDDTNWSLGLGKPVYLDNKNIIIINNHGKINAIAKELNENRGQAISDYQSHLEKTWIESLKNKYQVQINQNVFDALIQ